MSYKSILWDFDYKRGVFFDESTYFEVRLCKNPDQTEFILSETLHYDKSTFMEFFFRKLGRIQKMKKVK